jgi:hypothetical protein
MLSSTLAGAILLDIEDGTGGDIKQRPPVWEAAVAGKPIPGPVYSQMWMRVTRKLCSVNAMLLFS